MSTTTTTQPTTPVTEENTSTVTYVANPPAAIPKQCAYTLNVAMYWVGVVVLIILSLTSLYMFAYIFNVPRNFFSGGHPPIFR